MEDGWRTGGWLQVEDEWTMYHEVPRARPAGTQVHRYTGTQVQGYNGTYEYSGTYLLGLADQNSGDGPAAVGRLEPTVFRRASVGTGLFPRAHRPAQVDKRYGEAACLSLCGQLGW